jgi:hypothetical protein
MVTKNVIESGPVVVTFNFQAGSTFYLPWFNFVCTWLGVFDEHIAYKIPIQAYFNFIRSFL